MKFSTPGYQDMGKVLRGSMLSDSSRIFSCNESHFKHQNLKIRGQLSMLGSKSLNLKMRGQPSLLGSKSSPVSLHQNLEMRVLGTKSLSCVMLRKPKLLCKCFGSQYQHLTSLSMTLTPKDGVFLKLMSYKEVISAAVVVSIILTMFTSRRYQVECLVKWVKMNTAMASDVTVVLPTFITCVFCCLVLDLTSLKPLFTVGLASFLFSPFGKKILDSISGGVLFYKELTVGDFIYLKTKDVEVTGKVESMGLISPLRIRSLSGEVHSIPINTIADVTHVQMTFGPYKMISFKFAVSQNMAHKIDDILKNIDEIVSKFSSCKDEPQNFACVEGMDKNFKDVMILVSCLVKVDDVKEYIHIKGAIILEVFKLLPDINNPTSRV